MSKSLEKPIIKAKTASGTTFDYKAKEFPGGATLVARSFVNEDAFRSSDFKISALVAQQAGILQLESDAHQDKINAQVLARLADVEQKAYKEGHDLGLIEGTEKAFQDSKAALLEEMTALETLLKRIEELKGQLLIDNESELVQLAFFTAKKIALRDLETNREPVLEIIKDVIGEAQTEERVIVRLSPEDHNFLQVLQEKGGQRIESLQRIKFIVEDKIKPGGCLIETEYGSVNATIEERVERVWQTLQAKIPKKAPGSTE